jgi:hypothetical protein
MALPVVYIFFILLVAYLGRKRRIGFIGFLICSILFTPFPCLLVLLLTGRRGDPLTT